MTSSAYLTGVRRARWSFLITAYSERGARGSSGGEGAARGGQGQSESEVSYFASHDIHIYIHFEGVRWETLRGRSGARWQRSCPVRAKQWPERRRRCLDRSRVGSSELHPSTRGTPCNHLARSNHPSEETKTRIRYDTTVQPRPQSNRASSSPAPPRVIATTTSPPTRNLHNRRHPVSCVPRHSKLPCEPAYQLRLRTRGA